jgi:ABC-type sugar transport system permease subunit
MTKRAVSAAPHQHVAWLAVAPATGLLALLLLGPVLAVIIFSFTDRQIGAWSAHLGGLANYRELFADRVFWTPSPIPRFMSRSSCPALSVSACSSRC